VYKPGVLREPSYLGLCALLFLLAGGVWSPSHAAADPQLSARLVLGAGKRWIEPDEDDVVFETALRSEALFGPPRHRTFRIGPALEFRTLDFQSIEASGGLGMLIPTGDFAFVLTGLAGYAERKRAPDGAVGTGTLSWGYRGYNYHGIYGWGLHLYTSARHSLTGPDVLEVTGGVEIDVMFTTIIPALAIKNMFSSGDPHQN
jgi:hypothetical protein